MNLVGLIKFLFFLFIFYYLYVFITRYLFPFFVGKVMGNSNRDKRRDHYDRQKRKVGDVTINYKPEKDKRIDSGEGEYVDYEEVKD